MGDRRFRIVAALLVVGAATFSSGLSQAAGEAPELDLSTHEGRATYLIDLGIDPAEAIVQVGERLYAGPSCPGVGYACVDPQGAPVLQVVDSDIPGFGIAFSECTDDPGADPCTIVQGAGGAAADLTATCTFENPDQSPIQGNDQVQECSITQDNQSGGNNSATVRQRILHTASDKADQSGTQRATVDQVTVGAGGSTASFLQSSDLRNTLSTAGPIGSAGNRIEQVAEQRVELSQDSEDGNNDVDVSQVSNLKQDFTTNHNIFITQNAPDTTSTACGGLSVPIDSGQCTVVFQRAADAFNDASVTQEETLRQDAVTTNSNRAVDAIQGNPESGLLAELDGDQDADANSDSSLAELTQTKTYRQEASGTDNIALVQDDIDLGKLLQNSYHECSLLQFANLFQQPLLEQIINMDLFGHAEDSCHGEQHANANGTSSSTTSDESTFHLGTNCTNGVCESNNVPVANDDAYATEEDQQLSVVDPNEGVLANDTDADGDALSVDSFDAASAEGGGVNVGGDGTFTYDPPAGFVGDDTFTYTATDGTNTSNPATVTITVEAAPEPEPGFTLEVKNANSATYGDSASVSLFSSNIDHRLTATNAGAGDATGVTLTLSIPEGATVSGTLPSDCMQGGGAVTCSVGTVAADGGSAQRVIRLNYGGVNSCTFPGGNVPVNASYEDAEGNALNDSATVTKACL